MTAVAERAAPSDTPLPDRRSIWALQPLLDAVTIETDESTARYPSIAPRLFVQGQRLGSGWVNLGEQVKVVFVLPTLDMIDLSPPVKFTPTFSLSAPSFETPVGTGDLLNGIRDSVNEVWRGYATSAPLGTVVTTPLLLDIPGALQEARSQAGLPVQDLAAMFGIKRRQFYNLISGEQQPEPEREPSIARITDAINKVSDWVGGNSRTARALLLARLGGDSVYEAAVADDEERLAGAMDRAHTTAAAGSALPRRLAPSSRATSAEAAAVREFLRASRDDTGISND